MHVFSIFLFLWREKKKFSRNVSFTKKILKINLDKLLTKNQEKKCVIVLKDSHDTSSTKFEIQKN